MGRDNGPSERYQKLNQHQIKLKINKIREPELLEWVTSKENIQGYIKSLIRRDMYLQHALQSLKKSGKGIRMDD